MESTLHLKPHEKKLRHVIGIARSYDHAALLRFLEEKGMELEQFVKGFNFRTRAAFLAGAPAGVVAQELAFENITPAIGFEAITKALSGNISDPEELEVMVFALGTGTTPAADSDTTLETEGFRKLLSSVSYSGASAFYTAFIDLAEAVGSWTEMGLFMNADAGTPDDGTLWDRTLESITKTNSQSLTIDYEDDFQNAP